MTQQDIFISYAHVDNESLLEEQEGWISIFQRALQKRMGQLLGRQANVWWDRSRLSGNHYFDDTIAAGVENARVMVSIVTPRYLKSDYCKKEVDRFCRRGVKLGDRSLLFTCIKTPVEREALFEEMKGNLGYQFFRAEEASGRFREYDVYEPELKSLFMARLEDLAQDVSQLLNHLDSQVTPERLVKHSILTVKGAEEQSPTPEQVFVATTASDVKAVRENIRRELTSRDAPLYPTAEWSEDARSFEQELQAATRDVSLSVHIFGGKYGMIPEDAEHSYSVLQFEKLKELAGSRPPEQPLARIIWIPAEVEVSGNPQKVFLDKVRNDASIGPLDELLEGSEEELKERVIAKLVTLGKLRREREERALAVADFAQSVPMRSSIAPDSSVGDVKKIYVISDADEEPHVEDVERALAEQGFDVLSSVELAEEETEAEREALHQKWLEACDGCLIYHGKTKVRWVRAQIDDVRKAVGRREQGPMQGHAVYIAPPIEGLKRRYQVYFPKLEGGDTPAEDLTPFVAQLRESSEPDIAVSGGER